MKKRCSIILFLFGTILTASSQTKNLQYYIDQALVNSPLLKDYHNQVEASRLDSQLIRANYKPQLAASSSNTFAPLIRGVGYEQAITNGGGLNAVVSVNKAFASRKNLQAQFRSISLQQEGIQNTVAVSYQDLRKTITDQYITAYGTLQQLNFTHQVIVLLTSEESILKKLTEKNVYRQTDYLTFLVTLQQQQLSARQYDIQFKKDYAILNYLGGLQDTLPVVLEDPGLVMSEPRNPEQSVFFRQFTIDSLNLINNRMLLDISYKPKIGLYADGGYNSTLAYSPYKNFGTSFGLHLNVPIYDGRKRKLQQTKFSISQLTINGYRDFARNQYYQQIAQLKQQITATEELIGQINGQIKYSESLINVNARLLESGDAKITDLVIALNNYLIAKNLLTQNTISRLQIINQINYWNQ